MRLSSAVLLCLAVSLAAPNVVAQPADTDPGPVAEVPDGDADDAGEPEDSDDADASENADASDDAESEPAEEPKPSEQPDEAAVPSPEPAAAVAEPAEEEAPSNLAETAPPEGPPVEVQEEPGFWHSGYLVDYGLVATGALGFVAGHYFNPRANPLFGAPFNPFDPDRGGDDRINRDYLINGPGGETVPTTHLIAMVPGVLLGLAVLEGGHWAFSESGSPQKFHDVLVGYLESLFLTLGATEILKASVGRLRPDFNSRAAIQYCYENPDRAGCEDVQIPEGLTDAELDALVEDGRRSFPSGHSSIGVNIFTYSALVLGGRYVWGNRATRLSRGLGIFFQSLALGTGVFIATSRLDDGRHHDTDVFSGMFLGFGMANLAYWRRFDQDGLLLERKEKLPQDQIDVEVGPGPGDAGLSLRLRWH